MKTYVILDENWNEVGGIVAASASEAMPDWKSKFSHRTDARTAILKSAWLKSQEWKPKHD